MLKFWQCCKRSKLSFFIATLPIFGTELKNSYRNSGLLCVDVGDFFVCLFGVWVLFCFVLFC